MKRRVWIRILLGLFTIVLIVAGMIFYMFSQMKPAESGKITENFYAVKNNIVNFYVFQDDSHTICFDTGLDTVEAAKGLNAIGIHPSEVTHVFLTHSDGDHVGGLPLFDQAVVFFPAKEKQLIDGTVKRKFMFMKRENELPVRDYIPIADRETIQIESTTVHAILSPGHTPGSTAYVVNNQLLIAGDVMNFDKDGEFEVPPKFINNNHEQAIQTVEMLKQLNVSVVATGHDGFIKLK